jgi:hypothetical protein
MICDTTFLSDLVHEREAGRRGPASVFLADRRRQPFLVTVISLGEIAAMYANPNDARPLLSLGRASCSAFGFVAHPPMDIVNPFWFSHPPLFPSLGWRGELVQPGDIPIAWRAAGWQRVEITAPGRARKTSEEESLTASLRRIAWDQSTG